MTAFYPGTPPTRILSWQQWVLESDPNWRRLSLQPWVYEFSNGRLFVDPLPLYDFPAAADLGNDNGVLFFIGDSGQPTSSAGLDPGDVYSNGGVCTTVPGFTSFPGTPLVFGTVTAAQLLASGGIPLPTTQPAPGSLILWNPGGSAGGDIFVA